MFHRTLILAAVLIAAFAYTSFAFAAPVWTQTGAPILTATQPWEANAVYEPTVLKGPGGYRMWYTGGWQHPATGTATSRDGIHWTKYAGNPVLPTSARNTVIRVGRQFWMYYSNNVNDISLATSPDGIHFTPHGKVFTHPVWATNVANTFVRHEGQGRWVMMFDAGIATPLGYKMGLAYSTDGIHWVDSGAPLDLAIDTPTVGAPTLSLSHGVYRLYFLAGGNSINPLLPTDIYYTTSTDLTAWATPRMALTRSEPWEVDQVADPFAVGGFLYFAGCDNPAAFCAIGLATTH